MIAIPRWVLLGALAVACSACKEPLKSPEVTPESVTIGKMSPSGAEMEAIIDAVNPNKAELSATGMQNKVTIGGKPDVAKAMVTSSLVLPAAQRIKLKLPIKVEWTNADAMAALAATKQPAAYTVEGTVEFASRDGSVRTPFIINGVMTAEQLASAAGKPAGEDKPDAAPATPGRPSASAPTRR